MSYFEQPHQKLGPHQNQQTPETGVVYEGAQRRVKGRANLTPGNLGAIPDPAERSSLMLIPLRLLHQNIYFLRLEYYEQPLKEKQYSLDSART